MSQVLVLHGPNLDLLGTREPEIYGRQTLAEIDQQIRDEAAALGLEVAIHQSNHEGALIEHVHAAMRAGQSIVINAAGYTHTSVALRDAVAAARDLVPVIEVHLSVPEAREAFRHRSLLADVVRGRIEGFGGLSYVLALRAASTLSGARGDDRDQ